VVFDSPFYHPGSEANQLQPAITVSFWPKWLTPSPVNAQETRQFWHRINGSASFTLAPLLHFGMAPSLHIWHAWESLVPALHLFSLYPHAFKAVLIPKDFAASSHGQAVLRGMAILHPAFAAALDLVQPGARLCGLHLPLAVVTSSHLMAEPGQGAFMRGVLMAGCGLAARPLKPDAAAVLLYRRNPHLAGNVRLVSNWQASRFGGGQLGVFYP
jgi:hypothetical protein